MSNDMLYYTFLLNFLLLQNLLLNNKVNVTEQLEDLDTFIEIAWFIVEYRRGIVW